MKSLVKIFALVGLVVASYVPSLANGPKSSLNRMHVNTVVEAYINSSVNGQSEFAQEILSDDFVQRYQTGYKQSPVKKNAYIKHIKSLAGVKYDCNTAVEMIEESNGFSIAKVTLTFDHFTRTDYVSLTEDASGWKVKEVNSVFQNK